MDVRPAAAGGTPVRDSKIFYAHQSIDQSDIDAVAEVMRSDFLTCGPAIDAAEQKLCEVTGAKYAVLCSSGTAAQVIVNLGEWCYITTAKGDGYMRREYVAIPTDQATQQPQEAAEQDLQEPVGGVLYARVIQARQLMAQAAGLMEQARELLSDAG